MHSLDPVVTVRGVTSRCPFGVFLELPRSFLFTKLIVHFPWHLDVDAVFAKSFTAIAWKTPGTAYLPVEPTRQEAGVREYCPTQVSIRDPWRRVKRHASCVRLAETRAERDMFQATHLWRHHWQAISLRRLSPPLEQD